MSNDFFITVMTLHSSSYTLPVPAQLLQLLDPLPQHNGQSTHSLSPSISFHSPPVPLQLQHFRRKEGLIPVISQAVRQFNLMQNHVKNKVFKAFKSEKKESYYY
jgi:hypothetical protein